MARVVRRRKNPLLPVLLIFVFLFLIAATMAVLFYNNGQKDAKDKSAAIAKRRRVISDSEMRDGMIKQILSEKDKDRDAPTVVAELRRRIDSLTDRITGSKTSAADALAQIESDIGGNTFVLNAFKTSEQANTAAKAEIAKLKSEITTLASNQQDAVAAYKALEDQFKAKAATLAEEVQKLTTEKTELVEKHALAMKENDEKAQAKADKLAQDLDTRIAQVSKLTVEKNKLALQNDILRKRLIDRQKIGEARLTIHEAGKIKEVMPDRDVCFIPLGTQDRVVRGMTFRVYGPEGVPNDGEGHKAALTVIRTFKTISQCRVTTVNEEDPVAIGDPFANIAFDPTQPPVFVVQGRFDLSGMGRLTEAGTKEVISLIKRSGGKVTEELNVDVDFVVMGPEPAKPAKLDDGAPETSRTAHEIRMEEYKRWHATLNKAIALNIPKLNTKRFLTLTGYNVTKEYDE